jgi:hypothetical protein
LVSAKGHVYPLLLVRLALTWITSARSSYRAAALIFTTMKGLGIAIGPCAETIRLWLLRVGLFLLRRPLPVCNDWVYLLDLTIQLGQHKCLVILGVSLAEFRRNDCRLTHHDVHVLSVQVLAHCTGEAVYAHLLDLRSDVLAGLGSFRAVFPEVIDIYDITHGLALLLKRYLEPDARWDSFVKACQQTRQYLQQTAGSFLQPPAWRQKARYLNVQGHLAWAADMLGLLAAKVDTTLAEQLGCSAEQAKLFLVEKLGWLREYQEEVRQWGYFHRVVKAAEEEVKHHGLRQCSWRKVRQTMREDQARTDHEARFLREALKLVRQEGAKVPARQCFVGSTDVLESLFGKYKDLAEHGPIREVTASVLMFPLFVTTLTAGLLRQALESVHEQDVHIWLQENLGSSPQTKKRVVLAASRDP